MSTDLVGLISDLERNMSQVVLGKLDVIRMCLVALLAGEHVLLEDVPGVGKTLVAKALARSVDGNQTVLILRQMPDQFTGVGDSPLVSFAFVTLRNRRA